MIINFHFMQHYLLERDDLMLCKLFNFVLISRECIMRLKMRKK